MSIFQFFRDPFFNLAGFGVKINADQHDALAAVPEFLRIVFLVDLLQGFFGGLIQFEFKYVNPVAGLDDHVDASVIGIGFGLNVKPELS